MKYLRVFLSQKSTISIRWKLIIFVVGFNIMVAALLAYSVYHVSYTMFFNNYLGNKLMFAKTISSGIDGTVHEKLRSIKDRTNCEYEHLRVYLHNLKENDSSITYLYSLNYDRTDSNFYYCIDADVARDNILWVEAGAFAFEVHVDTGARPYIIYNQNTYHDSVSMYLAADFPFKVRLGQRDGKVSVLINGSEFALMEPDASTGVTVMGRTLNAAENNSTTTVKVGKKFVDLCLSISLKNNAFSNPGDFYEDTPENIKLYRDILQGGHDTIDATFKTSNYGRCVSAYGIIRDSISRPVGLVVVDFYERELSQLKSSVTRISVIISVLAIVIVLLVLSFVLEYTVIRHIKQLDSGIKLMAGKKLDTKIKIRSRDEFENLARGFNVMAKNLKSFYTDLDGMVKERTSTIEMQKEELQTQADTLQQANDLLNEQYHILSRQKDKIEQQKAELELVNMEITQQKQLLEKSNKQVMSSINYAMRIQRALLMSQQTIDKLLPQNFILYLPRDVVSGDFYYIREVNNHILVVAADCTGHGVPGAFMSMLGISFLNEIVQNSSIEMTNLVLDTLREKVISSFAGSETRDGMDLSMVVIQREKGVVHFSGAYNNLWVVRGADKAGGLVSELEEIKGDSMPIGVHPKDDVPFAMKELTLSKGDTFYLFSDGYHSQFGGPRYDKFKTKNFKQLIHSISNLPMSEQKSILEQRLMEWRGYSEQTDDVLVIGVRV